MNENRNLILAVILAGAVLLGWNYFVLMPQQQAEKAQQARLVHETAAKSAAEPTQSARPATATAAHLSLAAALKAGGPRVVISTPTLDGSLRLSGAHFDNLRLRNYHETTNPKSPEIDLLSPSGTSYPYFAVFGWLSASNTHLHVPDDSTPWRLAQGNVLTPKSPVVLEWDNGQGLTFTRTISVDDRYMFTVNDTVANRSRSAVTLAPYAVVERVGVPPSMHYWALHEGFVGATATDGASYTKYDDLKAGESKTFQSTGGWMGITDKYWMAAAIPPQNRAFDAEYKVSGADTQKSYLSDYRLPTQTIAAGASASVTHHMFAGAKVVSIIRNYQAALGIVNFDRAIDWGWFPFFTQPIFYLLDLFYKYLGNLGLAILLLTVSLKLLFLPLADASYRSMSRMKKLQPEVEKLRERFAEDKVRQQQEMMELYKREKVNPLSGCLPMFIQIPVFFCLYKVLLGTIEMRQAPFFGWIHDLSAPDPTSLFNLFGLLPYSIPAALPELGFLQGTVLTVLHVGAWPILMGLSQWVQTKMNPAPTDPVQQKMFAYMPLIFTFLMAGLPSGLIIYWTWNNLLSVTQQYIMMRRQGVEVHLFNNLKLPDSIRRLAGSGARANTHPGE
ncbi:MAG: membrane protein insertase YidC [Rhizomicrobium sp.]|jgi:YidC/Oxa1 family membrane protein insertase